MPTGVYERTHIAPPDVRFWAKVDRTDTCWIWLAARNGKYGAFGVRHKDVRPAHRYAYELAYGPIPEGLTIDHLCRNTLCVNPAHLEAVTLRENILRGNAPTIVLYKAGVCRRGHKRTPENTYVSPAGGRLCRECMAIVRSTPEYKQRVAERARLRYKRKRLPKQPH